MNEQIITKVSAMADVPSSSASAGTKMFPMKLFSSWEVEKSSPHCIPRFYKNRTCLYMIYIFKPIIIYKGFAVSSLRD